MKRLLLAALGVLMLASGSFAIVDQNENGISDLWERAHNDGELFPETFDPQADPDGDGWTNAVEAAAGTNPFDPNPPNGLIRPQIVQIPAVLSVPDAEGNSHVITPQAVTVTWPTLAGKHYTLLFSPDLSQDSWMPVGDSFVGNGNEVTYGFEINESDKRFWRVAVTDVDTDGDGLTDAEEHEIGSSPYLADTNDDGIDDATALAMNLNPAGSTADADGDGVNDNEYFSIELELEYEGRYRLPPNPFPSNHLPPGLFPDREELNARYFTREWAFSYSVADSPRYSTIADGSYIHKTTMLDEGVLVPDAEATVTEEGKQLNPWLAENGTELGEMEYLVSQATQTAVSEPVTTITDQFTYRGSTTTKSTVWEVRKRQGSVNSVNDPVERSGTEVIENTHWTKLSGLISYPDYWNAHVENSAWEETRIEERGPLYEIRHLGPGSGDEDAAGIVRDFFKSDTFSIDGIISSPSVDVFSAGRDERLKALRWRWVRFNPQNPFEYDYTAPPPSYRKTFLLAVKQRDRLGEDHDGDLEDTLVGKGAVEIECVSSQGTSGWQELPMSQFESLRVEEPVHLESIGFSGKIGDTKTTFQNVPADLVSRDRMIAGHFTIPSNWADGFEVQFVNTTTGEDLGTYGNFLDSTYGPRLDYSDAQLFDEAEMLAYEAASLDPRIQTQKVTFCGDRSEGRPIEFYTVFASVGNVQVRLLHNGEVVGVLRQTLVEDPAFGRLIDHVSELVGGDAGVTPDPVAGAPVAFGGPPEDSMHPLARRALIPLFNGFGAWLSSQTDSEALILGLLDGIKQGVLDDKALIEWLHAQNLHLQYVMPAILMLEVQRWMDDPYARAAQTANAIRNAVRHGFYEPMKGLGSQLGDLAGNFSSLERFKEFNWKVHQGWMAGQVVALQLITDSSGVILNGLGSWYSEFCGRMYEGAELSMFQSISMGDLPWWRQDLRTFYRTFGYSLGYMGEQLLLGKGITALAKGMAKLGPKTALSSLPSVKRFGLRIIPFFDKRWTARVVTTSDHEATHQAIRAAQTSRLDARTTLDDGARPVADALDELISRQAGSVHGKLLAEEIHASPKIRQTIINPATRSLFFDRLAVMERLLGSRFDDVATRNFTRMYDRTILLDPNTGGDMFDLTIKSFHSNFSPNGPLDDISEAGKDLLEFFLKDPNGGSPWKLGFNGSPNQNLGRFVRGNLIELHSAKIGRHKTASYLDELNDTVTEGIDFEYANQLVVQQTSTALGAASDLMLQKLDHSARAALAAKGEGCMFQFDVHWLSNNGRPDLSRLESLAIELRDELEISIEIADTPTFFNQWLP